MKIITLLLMIVGINVAQAEVYKCPGKTEGKYTYQSTPCKGAKEGEHTIKIIPADEKKIAEAREKLDKEVEESNAKESEQQQPKIMLLPGAGAQPAKPRMMEGGSLNPGMVNPHPVPGLTAPQPGLPSPAPALTNPPVPAVPAK